ncbi:hypothetical protein ACHAW5_004376 [Stephanodiscus triporus]|uniref:Leucine-rich repeat-containing N-terminal plant-type domain-containing protein n=1 Tax=Stephanodiscus triporus TaxID=2934178 RepID=A0ABD3QDH4_9STRA
MCDMFCVIHDRIRYHTLTHAILFSATNQEKENDIIIISVGMTPPHYTDASNPAEWGEYRDGYKDDAGLEVIRDEIKKLWAVNSSLRDEVRKLEAFVRVVRTVAAVATTIVVASLISVVPVARRGRGVVAVVGGDGRGGMDWDWAGRRHDDAPASVRGRGGAGRTADATDADAGSDDGVGTFGVEIPPAPADASSSSRALQGGSLELDIDEALMAAVAATNTSSLERSALTDFYHSTNGMGWTVRTGWLDPSVDHCDWHGVECDDANGGATVRLELPSNDLSGTLTPRIAELMHLEVLNVNDNGIKGSIPTEISLLSNLTRLQLSYNVLTGSGTNFGNLSRLRLIHLHGNRLSGSIPPLDFKPSSYSSYITDCGNPSDFLSSLDCEECTMCCNNEGYCYPQEETLVQQAGFSNYRQFTWFFIAMVICAAIAVYLMSFAYDRYQTRRMGLSLDRSMTRVRDQKYAIEVLGEGSTNQFFLGKSVLGWFCAGKNIAIQFWVILIFVDSSEYDLSDSKVDIQYTWKCNQDGDECFNTSDLTWHGWLAFGMLMFVHLARDVINGFKMITLSAKARHSNHTRMRFFVGGTILLMITLFAVYASIIYNKATATGEWFSCDVLFSISSHTVLIAHAHIVPSSQATPRSSLTPLSSSLF